MTGKKDRSDARLNVARYQGEKRSPPTDAPEPEENTAGQSMMEARAQYVEMAIQQAIRRGEFDNLPGAGKPLPNLQNAYDPDWWIRQKIESEKITGLGPPALTLRTEHAALDARLDAATSEAMVREILEDFNRRVVSARRQLQGGPPVVTPTRDIAAEVSRWRERRAARSREREQQKEREVTALDALSWRERRRARRAR
ncbi:DUF1992 domain-containing protein [Cryobacterium psychrophilum]|uniref:DUF1992 domain-containing protein n=1 Tax=Cryobacterium psychrophilum TaxID=41988 RepID=A0A4Y8KU40_9MICO|nr:DUF1992 domain-containing protein [Cryobacterium psychrophilum]TDW28704.1 uncharacterized protein DUF1992 [Cryobacterium psychrophilum]TFD82363.1 DUF1992 domain-containing protein [Cryobacterium psychrophilum]